MLKTLESLTQNFLEGKHKPFIKILFSKGIICNFIFLYNRKLFDSSKQKDFVLENKLRKFYLNF